MPQITDAQRTVIFEATEAAIALYRQRITGIVQAAIPHYAEPPDVKAFFRALRALEGDVEPSVRRAVHNPAGSSEVDVRPIPAMKFAGSSGAKEIDARHIPAIKFVVSIARRQLAEELEGSRQLTSNSFLWSTFDQRLRRYDEIMEYEWFRNGEALRPPRLAELLTLQLAEQAVQQSVVLPERAYDEKFHILQAPGLFLPDLKYFRTLCELRGRPVAVAYADIDNFKALNTKYGESVVDVHILPAFMRALESFVFARGRAYRHGGDEYLILLPNCDQGYAVHLLNNLREEVRTLRYPQVGDTLTVSIGLCVLEVDSFLTDREAQHRANQAKNYAKQAGRDCIASFVGPLYRDDDLTKL